MSTDKYTDADYQRAVSDFVYREVHYCVSGLISDLAKWTEGECYDNLLSVCVSDDYESAAYEAGWSQFTDEFGANCYRDENDGQTWAGANWQELCGAHDIEPQQNEAYEHWIVSDWLARKLEAVGEMVSFDIHGLTVWGRTTTGQSISMDRVICDIYDAMTA